MKIFQGIFRNFFSIELNFASLLCLIYMAVSSQIDFGKLICSRRGMRFGAGGIAEGSETENMGNFELKGTVAQNNGLVWIMDEAKLHPRLKADALTTSAFISEDNFIVAQGKPKLSYKFRSNSWVV